MKWVTPLHALAEGVCMKWGGYKSRQELAQKKWQSGRWMERWYHLIELRSTLQRVHNT